MIIVFFILIAFFVTVALFIYHELFVVKKNTVEQGKIIISIDEWDEDLLEAFICHVRKFNRYIEIRIIVRGKRENEQFQKLLREKYDILWIEA